MMSSSCRRPRAIWRPSSVCLGVLIAATLTCSVTLAISGGSNRQSLTGSAGRSNPTRASANNQPSPSSSWPTVAGGDQSQQQPQSGFTGLPYRGPLTPAALWTKAGQLYAQSSYYYADYKVPRAPPPQKQTFAPSDPPNCPQTGRTVCEDVDKYPLDTVFDVVRSAASDRFNFSSIFMDERDGDEEPQFVDPTPPPPSYGKPTGRGYVVTHYGPSPGTKSVNDYYTPNYNRGPARGYESTPPIYQQQYDDGYGPQEQPPVQQRPVQFPQGNIRETRSYGPPRPSGGRQGYGNGRDQQAGSGFGPDDQQRTLDDGLSESLADLRLGYDELDDPERALQQAVAPSVVPPSAALWRPFYPGARHLAESIRHSTGSRFKRQTDDDEEATEVCRTQMQFISPKAALNDKAQWKYIVNLGERDPRLRQVIKVHVCSRPNEPCSSQISLPFGFASRCRQKYVKKKLLSLDDDGRGTSSENFFVPSCCVCEIVRSSAAK